MISLNYWWVGFLTYVPFHVLHVVIWRVAPPRRDALELVLYLLVLPIALGLIWVGFGGPLPWSAILLHLLLGINYIAIYPAFQATSPTVHVLCLLREEILGVEPEKVERVLSETTSLGHRVHDLHRGGLILRTEQGQRLSGLGNALAQFFILFRRVLGLSQGAG